MTDSIAIVIMLTLIAINLSYIRIALNKCLIIMQGQNNDTVEIHVTVNGSKVKLRENDSVYVDNNEVYVNRKRWMPY